MWYNFSVIIRVHYSLSVSNVANTKIINIQKDDSFADVFDAFKNATAEEVIFIFPKGSKIARQENNFNVLKEETEKTGKIISIMTNDPIVADLAASHGMTIISGAEPKTIKSDDYERPEPEEIASITLASARLQKKVVRDIFTEEPEVNLEVKSEKEKSVDLDIAKVWAPRSENHEEIFLKPQKRTSHGSGKRKKLIGFAGVGVLLALLAILYGVLARADIIIKPQIQNLNFPLTINASSTAAAISPEFNKIPGQSISAQAEAGDTFPATGFKNVVQKAGGEIIIYNQIPLEQRLVATTRFESPAGFIFRIPATITVPGSTKQGGRVVPGSIESAVFADRAGAEYNIGPARFTVPGLKGTSKYGEFYATANQPMTGGLVGPSKVVSESDFVKAQEELTKTVREKVINSLAGQVNGLKILDSIDVKIDDPAVNAKAGEVAEELKMTVRGSAQTIAFRETDVIELVKSYLTKNGNLEIVEKKIAISYRLPALDSSGKTLSFTADIALTAASRIDTAKILKEAAGLEEDQIRVYFRNIKEIGSARVNLSPFWVRKIPTNPAKIHLRIDTD